MLESFYFFFHFQLLKFMICSAEKKKKWKKVNKNYLELYYYRVYLRVFVNIPSKTYNEQR